MRRYKCDFNLGHHNCTTYKFMWNERLSGYIVQTGFDSKPLEDYYEFNSTNGKLNKL